MRDAVSWRYQSQYIESFSEYEGRQFGNLRMKNGKRRFFYCLTICLYRRAGTFSVMFPDQCVAPKSSSIRILCDADSLMTSNLTRLCGTCRHAFPIEKKYADNQLVTARLDKGSWLLMRYMDSRLAKVNDPIWLILFWMWAPLMRSHDHPRLFPVRDESHKVLCKSRDGKSTITTTKGAVLIASTTIQKQKHVLSYSGNWVIIGLEELIFRLSLSSNACSKSSGTVTTVISTSFL
jgi:hypothetical protein